LKFELIIIIKEMDSLNKIIKFNVRGVKFKLHQKYIDRVQDSTFAQDFSESNNIF
jgi:hypothetical protein